jgi:hypothetical protein
MWLARASTFRIQQTTTTTKPTDFDPYIANAVSPVIQTVSGGGVT